MCKDGFNSRGTILFLVAGFSVNCNAVLFARMRYAYFRRPLQGSYCLLAEKTAFRKLAVTCASSHGVSSPLSCLQSSYFEDS